ncbi:MAG: hypothetical protein JXR94_24820 [Candidatus Hydrogenedentes bacterium]|nr:hypothetical protein [Candidatus Hydrogenedentota bacterium]
MTRRTAGTCPGRAAASAAAPARTAGICLIDLTTALFVLSLGVFGALQAFQYGTARIRTIREASVAARAVQNEIETLRALPFQELANGERAAFVSDSPETAALHNATPYVRIEDGASAAPGALKQVFVRIRWTGDYGRTIEQHATTLIADKGQGGAP